MRQYKEFSNGVGIMVFIILIVAVYLLVISGVDTLRYKRENATRLRREYQRQMMYSKDYEVKSSSFSRKAQIYMDLENFDSSEFFLRKSSDMLDSQLYHTRIAESIMDTLTQ